MPRLVYRFDCIARADLPADEQKCSICGSEYAEKRPDLNGGAVRLPCGHVFGADCILEWANNVVDITCPTCRHRLPTHEDHTYDEDTQRVCTILPASTHRPDGGWNPKSTSSVPTRDAPKPLYDGDGDKITDIRISRVTLTIPYQVEWRRTAVTSIFYDYATEAPTLIDVSEPGAELIDIEEGPAPNAPSRDLLELVQDDVPAPATEMESGLDLEDVDDFDPEGYDSTQGEERDDVQ
ncbi:MAG: hypothetical protein Q9195_008876 [Heterodermia aff. obscurata]